MTTEYEPLDRLPNPSDCNCTFTPYGKDDPEESYHFLRECPHCKHQWYSLHCPHESARPCPECKKMVPRISEPWE